MSNTGTLQVTTPTDKEIVLTRVFDAPCQMVFDALTKPELLERWYGAWRRRELRPARRAAAVALLTSSKSRGKGDAS
jgi:uncharacterized protein YndB with AHSA1/START domain